MATGLIPDTEVMNSKKTNRIPVIDTSRLEEAD